MPQNPLHKLSCLENGLWVATAEMPWVFSVCVSIWVGVGSRYESADINGATHFIEHMLFKGTKKRSAHKISCEIEELGGHINAWTSEENTCFHAIASANHFPHLLDVLVDMFHFSKFAKADVDKEREVIKDEIAMYRDQPQQYIEDLLNEALWNHHPLGRPITGTEESVDKLTRDLLLDFKERNYTAPNTIIVVAGAVEHETVLKEVEKYVRFFRKGERAKFERADTINWLPEIKICKRELEQTHVAIGFRGISRHNPARFALRVLNAIIAENMSSRLFRMLRDEHGLVYNIYSSPSFVDDTGDWSLVAGMDDTNVIKTLRIIFNELKKLTEKKPSCSEINIAKEFLIGQLLIGLETSESQMNWLGEQLIGYRKITPVEEVIKRLREVSAEDVINVARTIFKPQNAALAVIGPLNNQDELKKLVEILG